MFCCACVWLFWALVTYKVIDWLVRKPFVRGRDHRYILVTGCDTGFGHEITKRLDRKGYNVFAGCLTEKGEQLLRKGCSNRLKTVRLNVADQPSVRRAYQFVKENLPKGKGLWGLVNNAGISGALGPVTWLQMPDYHNVFSVNLLGLIDVTVTFLPLIKKAKGRVVSTASIFGRTSMLGGAPYTISKYGVEAFMDGLRRELYEFGCTAHLIEPGFHKTNIASVANLTAGLETSWAQLPPDIRAEYGQGYYVQSKDLIVNKFVNKIASERISDVVDAYENALLARFPRARYVVGRDAKYFWLPVQWLPEWIGDLVLRGASRDRPLPAALKKAN